MDINTILKKQREIWWDEKLKLWEIIVVMWKVFWDICRRERNAPKDVDVHNDDELKKELWNIIISTVRWCDDLGYTPEECIEKAFLAQQKFDK